MSAAAPAFPLLGAVLEEDSSRCALPQHPLRCCSPIAVVRNGEAVIDCSLSEDVEGGSPTSERSTSVSLTGGHASRVSAPKKGALRWVLRQLTRKQQQYQEEQEGCVTGSSYDSLIGLEEQCSSGNPRALSPAAASYPQQQQQADAAAGQSLLTPTGTQQGPQQESRQQQQQPSSSHEQAGQPSASSSLPDSSTEGLLRRAVKCVLRPVVRAVCGAVRALASSAGPQGPGNNDHSMAERVVNVLTSLPFFAVGLHGLRNRRCPKGRHFALSFLALGAVASGYHGADRASWLRPVMRKLDYYTICYTSTVLRRAAHIPLPPVVAAAAVVVAPLKPTLVTGMNLLLVEGKFLRSALAHPNLRSGLRAHLGSAAVGMVCFAYEDVATGAGWPPVLHSLWHCLSAAAMGCLHGFLEHLELAVLVEGWQLETAAAGPGN